MCDHDHEHDGSCSHGDDVSSSYSLYQKIDMANVECLNERIDGSGIKVFKPWNERLNMESYVESDCDAEIIYNIPFTGDVKLKGVIVIGDEELSKIRLFKSKMRMSFADIGVEADQTFDAAYDPQGNVEYPVKVTKFFNVHHLTIHFVNENREDDSKPCKIYYIGLKGDFSPVNRDAIVIANYEISPTEGIPDELRNNSREVQ